LFLDGQTTNLREIERQTENMRNDIYIERERAVPNRKPNSDSCFVDQKPGILGPNCWFVDASEFTSWFEQTFHVWLVLSHHWLATLWQIHIWKNQCLSAKNHVVVFPYPCLLAKG
jgi:hypothetical protein